MRDECMQTSEASIQTLTRPSRRRASEEADVNVVMGSISGVREGFCCYSFAAYM